MLPFRVGAPTAFVASTWHQASECFESACPATND